MGNEFVNCSTIIVIIYSYIRVDNVTYRSQYTYCLLNIIIDLVTYSLLDGVKASSVLVRCVDNNYCLGSKL